MHSQHCSILHGLWQSTSHMCKANQKIQVYTRFLQDLLISELVLRSLMRLVGVYKGNVCMICNSHQEESYQFLTVVQHFRYIIISNLIIFADRTICICDMIRKNVSEL